MALTHELRAQLYSMKTQDLFQKLQEHHMLMAYMEESDEKTTLAGTAAGIHSEIMVCSGQDEVYKNNIDAVANDDLDALEAIYIEMEKEMQTY